MQQSPQIEIPPALRVELAAKAAAQDRFDLMMTCGIGTAALLVAYLCFRVGKHTGDNSRRHVFAWCLAPGVLGIAPAIARSICAFFGYRFAQGYEELMVIGLGLLSAAYLAIAVVALWAGRSVRARYTDTAG